MEALSNKGVQVTTIGSDSFKAEFLSWIIDICPLLLFIFQLIYFFFVVIWMIHYIILIFLLIFSEYIFIFFKVIQFEFVFEV
jgi:hypothetical protein